MTLSCRKLLGEKAINAMAKNALLAEVCRHYAANKLEILFTQRNQ